MKTKKITLYYSVTNKEVIPPKQSVLDRKDAWLGELMKSVEAEWKPRIVKVTYEIFNPETEQQRKFFEGPVVEFFAVQHEDIYEGEISNEKKKRYRETLLDWALGFDVQLIDKRMVRRRKTTTDFIETQQWSDFLNNLEEGIFEEHGYEFPDSKDYWKLAEQYGYEKAKEISIEQLKRRMRSRNPQGK